MARILVAGTTESLGGRALAERLAARIRQDGHDADLLGATPLPEVRDADAVVCLLDGPVPPPAAVAAAATAHALGKPALALHTHPIGDAMATLFTQSATAHDETEFAGPLAAFYAYVRPFAGRLVRDEVPRLVREAGHAVRFREAGPDERPRYLKRKVVEEATELLAADGADEREEVADLLEALEAFLQARGIARDDLRAAKEEKRRRRGSFEHGYVVEATGPAAAAAMDEPEAAADPYAGAFTMPSRLAPRPAPPAPAPAAPATSQVEGGPSAVWNVGTRGQREAVAPKVEDPDRIEPAVRDV